MINLLKQTYGHVPTLSTVTTGVLIGAGRIGVARLITPPLVVAGVVSTASVSTAVIGGISILLIVARIFISVIIAPLFEEAWFRDDLKKDAGAWDIFKNSASFGLMHGLLPGSLEYRIYHIMTTTIGGFFYCSAQVVTGDTWAPAIAHSMHNLSCFI